MEGSPYSTPVQLPPFPPDRLSQRGERGFDVMHQRVCSVRQLIALLDELSRSSSRLTRSPAHFSRKRRAAVEMVLEPLGQIHSATRTQVRVTAHKV